MNTASNTGLLAVSLASIAILGIIAMGLSLSGLIKWSTASYKNKMLTKEAQGSKMETPEIDEREHEGRECTQQEQDDVSR